MEYALKPATLILLFILAVIARDEYSRRRELKEGRPPKDQRASEQSDVEKTVEILKKIEKSTSYQGIIWAIQTAWVQEIKNGDQNRMINENPRQKALKAIENLPESASWTEALMAVRRAWVEKVPHELLERAVAVFKREEKAIKWLTSPNLALGGHIPVEYAGSKEGLKMVFAILERIKHGVYSSAIPGPPASPHKQGA